MAKTKDELAKAMDNHAAQAAIAVFSRTEYSPNPLPFSWSGNRAVLVAVDRGRKRHRRDRLETDLSRGGL